MDVFITGASGYVGGVITEHLVAAGHQVTALTRSDAAAARVTTLGAIPLHGDLFAGDLLREAAGRAGAVVHTAIDYTDPAMADAEASGLRAMLDGSAGKPFVYTSTGLVYPGGPEVAGRALTEDEPVDAASAAQPHKLAGEQAVLGAEGVQGIVLRVALVHGRGGSGLPLGLLGLARQAGIAPYIGDGGQEWPAVHVDDLAELFTLAIKNPVPGIFNVAAPDAPTARDLAQTIGEVTGATPTSLTLEQAQQLAPVLTILARTGRLDATKAQTTFGWFPRHPGLLEDLRSPAYAA